MTTALTAFTTVYPENESISYTYNVEGPVVAEFTSAVLTLTSQVGTSNIFILGKSYAALGWHLEADAFGAGSAQMWFAPKWVKADAAQYYAQACTFTGKSKKTLLTNQTGFAYVAEAGAAPTADAVRSGSAFSATVDSDLSTATSYMEATSTLNKLTCSGFLTSNSAQPDIAVPAFGSILTYQVGATVFDKNGFSTVTAEGAYASADQTVTIMESAGAIALAATVATICAAQSTLTF